VARRFILIADSHRDCRETMAHVLKLDGHEVCTAVDYEGVKRSLAHSHVDVLLLDSRLRGCDALVFAHSQEAALAKRVIVMATYLPQSGRPLNGQRANRVIAMPKPVDFPTLRILLDELVPA
jgi:DNA-binding NtrC family response regulator